MKLKRIIALLSALLFSLSSHATAASAEAPALKSFSFSCYGSAVESSASYSVYETKRGWLARIELYYTHTIILPICEAELTALSLLIEKEDLAAWSDFKYKDDTDLAVCDGDGFSLSVVYADDSAILADGSNLFPSGYYEGRDAILSFFGELMESYNIEI